MKSVENLRKRLIKLCNEKFKTKKITCKDISKKMNIEEKSVEKFFKNDNNAKLDTVIKILSCLDSELSIKMVK